MSVEAVRREIASLESYGHLHVNDAKILVSAGTLGKHVSKSEHALLRSFKEDVVDRGYITSSRAARDTLAEAVSAGPTTMLGYVKSAFLGALAWGASLAIGAGLIGGAVVRLTAGGNMGDLATAATVAIGVMGGGALGAAFGAWRGVRD